MKLHRIVPTLLLLTLTACSTNEPSEPTYSGEYFYNFESSYLTPDGKEEAWCINAAVMTKAMLPAKDANGQWGTSHVVVRGKLGPEGSFGGMGRCKRVLEVTEIIKVTNMRARD